MPFLIIGFVLLFILTSIPNWWTKRILKKYAEPHPDIPGTGQEFAKHLIKKHKLAITLEEIPSGDHYDPVDKVMRISSQNFHTNSLTAITTVAHEIGHAIQDKEGYEPLKQRTALIERSQWMQKFSGFALIITPILVPIFHTPMIALITFTAGFMAMGVPVIIHLNTLPVEFDASYKRALPLLEEGKYLSPKDQKAAKKILWACAMTYVAASLSSLLNLWKWLRAIKGR